MCFLFFAKDIKERRKEIFSAEKGTKKIRIKQSKKGKGKEPFLYFLRRENGEKNQFIY